MFHIMPVILTTVALMLLPINVLQCAEGVLIHLKEKAYVKDGEVFIKDIATIQGADPDRVKVLENIPLNVIPEFGIVNSLSRNQINSILQGAMSSLPVIQYSGAVIVQIHLQGRPALFEEIAATVKTYLMETTLWQDSEIEIRAIKNLQEIELPSGNIELRVSSKSPIYQKGNILLPVDVIQSGKFLDCFWAAAVVLIRADILTARAIIRYGKVIAEEDIVMASIEIVDLKSAYLRNPDDVLGKVAQRNISPGDPLTCEELANPFLVKSGETIRLHLKRNGIALTSLVRAEQNGRLGQVIRVRNLEFSRSLKAEVTGRAEVVMQ